MKEKKKEKERKVEKGDDNVMRVCYHHGQVGEGLPDKTAPEQKLEITEKTTPLSGERVFTGKGHEARV